MEKEDPRIREAFRLEGDRQSPCLDGELLDVFYAEGLSEGEADTVREHLSICAACLELSIDFRRFAGVHDEGATNVNPITSDNVVSLFAHRGGLKIAATLLLVATLGVIGISLRTPTEPSTVRSGVFEPTIELLEPRGDIESAPRLLEWRALDGIDHYEIEIRDLGLRTLWGELRLEAPRAVVPDEIVDRLDAGSEYAWRVTAVDKTGQRIQSSFATFLILEK